MATIRMLGIDPGISGAAAILRCDGPMPVVVAAIDLPVVESPKRGRATAHREINALALGEWIVAQRPDLCVLERVQAMPAIPDPVTGVRRQMGAASAFAFGATFGDIRTTIALAGVPLVYVTPRSWKKYFGMAGPDKEASRQKALQLFPAAADFLTRKKDHARAESMLMALFGWRHHAAARPFTADELPPD